MRREEGVECFIRGGRGWRDRRNTKGPTNFYARGPSKKEQTRVVNKSFSLMCIYIFNQQIRPSPLYTI